MSNKAVIEAIKAAMVGSIRALERDMSELKQLQSSGNNSNWNFAVASYRGSYRSLKKGLEFISRYRLLVPECEVVVSKQGRHLMDCEDILHSPTQGKKVPTEASTAEKQDVATAVSAVEQGLPDEQALQSKAFILNPISGIECMARGIPLVLVGIGVATEDANKRVSIENSVIYDTGKSAFYTSTKGKGSYINLGYDVRLSVSLVSRLENANIFTYSSTARGLQETSASTPDRKRLITKMAQLSLTGCSYISFPNVEMGIIYVAAGKCDIMGYCGHVDKIKYLNALSIAVESGAIIMNSEGKEINMHDIAEDNKGFFVSNRRIVGSLQQFLAK